MLRNSPRTSRADSLISSLVIVLDYREPDITRQVIFSKQFFSGCTVIDIGHDAGGDYLTGH